MASGSVQVYGCVSAYAGIICLMIATYASEWKTLSHYVEGVSKPVVVRVGLWMACSTPAARKLECTVYETILHVPIDICVTRAIMITSITLSVCGLAVAFLGMKYTLCLNKEERVKNKVAFSGGILLIIAGLGAMGIVSWYAYAVISYHPASKKEPKTYLGKCLFLGWVGALLTIIGGLLLSCCGLSKCTTTSRRSNMSTPTVQLDSAKIYI